MIWILCSHGISKTPQLLLPLVCASVYQRGPTTL
jgi:hypothetical protein